MTTEPAAFQYTNLSDRPTSTLVRLASVLSTGVRDVQAQVIPFAQHWERSNRAALQQYGPLWVAIGDSMTQGIGASAFDQGWVGQLGKQLTEAGRPHRIINLSTSGARVQDVLDRQLPALESSHLQPDLVTVLIGSNDLVSRRQRAGLAGRVAVMLRRLPRGSVVANIVNPTRTAALVNAEIDRAVVERGLVLANMRESRTMNWRGRLAPDHFHPNDRGYAGIAAVFAEAVGLTEDRRQAG